MKNRYSHRADEDRRAAKSWSAPRVQGVVPIRRTRGGSGEQNGDVDDVIYDLS